MKGNLGKRGPVIDLARKTEENKYASPFAKRLP